MYALNMVSGGMREAGIGKELHIVLKDPSKVVMARRESRCNMASVVLVHTISAYKAIDGEWRDKVENINGSAY